jgi:hypothetical protein
MKENFHDFSNTLFRCSALGRLMTNDRTGKAMGDTCRKYLLEVYAQEKHGRRKEINTKYTTKGLQVEEDSITVYSRFKKDFFKKNEERIFNAFVIGTPDLFDGPATIHEAELIIDVKSSWDLFTFLAVLGEKINKDYWWQLQGYMMLTGATRARLAYCLVDTPPALILDEQRRLMWKMGVATDEDPLYIEAAEALEKNMTYADIPLRQRVIEFDVERDEDAIASIRERVVEARTWLNNFETRRMATAQTVTQ